MAGETTSVAASAARGLQKPMAVGVVGYTYTLTYSTTQNQLADVMEAGYLPANVTVVGALVKATDMDTAGSPLVVHKITVGSTDIVTGITAAQTGTNSVHACTPLALTARTLVKVITSTAADTAAAGTMYVTLLVVNN